MQQAAAVSVRPVVEPEAEPEPEMGSSEALVSTADVLEELAAHHESKHELQTAIALRLLAIQVLLAAFRQASVSLHMAVQDAAPHVTLQQQQEGQPEQVEVDHRQHEGSQYPQDQQQASGASGQAVTSAHQFSLFSKQISQRLLDTAGRVEDSLSALQQDGQSTAVPYVWQVVYQGALAYAQTAATQEIIGGIRACIVSYSQVWRLLPLSCASLCLQSSTWAYRLQLGNGFQVTDSDVAVF